MRNAFEEINIRENCPEKFVYCETCKTGTKSVDGVCAVCMGDEE